MKTNKDFLKDVTHLALPMAFQMLISNLVTVINNIMIGSMGEINITAISVCGSFEFFDSMLVWAISDGCTILASQQHGRKENDKIKHMFSFITLINLAITVVVALIIFLIPDSIIRVYTNIEAVVEPGAIYLKYMGISLFFFALTTSINAILNSIKAVKVGLYGSIAGCGISVILNYLLIEGHLGFPALGIHGAGISLLSGRVATLLISLIYLLFFDKELKFKIKEFDPKIDKKDFDYFFKVSYPIIIMSFLQNCTTSCQTMITGRISEYYIAANSIVHMAWLIPNVFSMGISSASGVYIGHEIGEGNVDQVRKDGKRFLILGLIFGAFSAVLVQVTLPILLQFYDVSIETVKLATQMGYSCSLIVFFNSNYMVCGEGVFRAAGDTKIQLIIDTLSTWLFALPFGYVAAFILKWPAYIIYIIVRSATIIKAIFSMIMIAKGDWVRISN